MSDSPSIAKKSAERIVIVGGGAAGLACAWRLSGAGRPVVLIESGEPGGGALKASGGMLAAGFESVMEVEPDHDLAPAFVRFAHAAADLWPGWAERLQAQSGRALAYERRGSITPIFTKDESERAAAAMERARTLGVEACRMDADAVAAAEPNLAASLGAMMFPADGQVDNRALGVALTEAARARGVEIVNGRRVTGLVRAAGRVAGVELDAGDPIEGAAVILATGASAAPGAPLALRMEPVKGQMIAFAAARPMAPSLVVRGFSIYLAAKPNMRLVAGATSEPGCGDEETDDEAAARLAEAARAVIPGLKAASVMERWAGVRPRTADSMPVIGEAEPGLYAAGGGYRNGVLLAPAIAEALAARLEGGEDWPSAAPFTPERDSLSGAQR